MIRKCECGSREFWGHQVHYTDVKLDGDDQFWLEDGEIYEVDSPYGPYTCAKCCKEYDKWEDIPEAEESEETKQKGSVTHD